MSRILVTNDDGVSSPGLVALVDALRPLGQITVVAPDRERSAVGHSLTFFHPVRVEPTRVDEGVTYYACDGTPTDCVLLGLFNLMKDEPPLLVVSGINRGANLGDDVHYSGTVSAAVEAAIHAVPSFAVSLASFKDLHWETAAHAAQHVARNLLARAMPPRTFLNVNVPNVPLAELEGFAVTAQGRSVYNQHIVARTDPRGNHYYWITGDIPGGVADPGTDFEAVRAHKVSVTPMQLALTEHALLDTIRGWGL